MPKGNPIFENGKPILERLKNVSAPTLLIAGDTDIASLEMAELVVKQIPMARKVVISKAGHFFNSEQSEVFNRELLAFLKDK
jgi:pimeloyl-ACP methyl ester carboxylesterase